MQTKPIPTKENLISRLNSIVPITSVVDVGVREGTFELTRCFPKLKHYLFEPVPLFFGVIEKNYSTINHTLYPFALSDISKTIYLVTTSLNKNGKTTHSYISQTPLEVDGLSAISCGEVDVRRWDDLDLAKQIENNFLLKIDVDGEDLNVAKGFGEAIKKASIIVIECTYSTMLDRMYYLSGHGYQMIDIVDLVYYGHGLYQFDMVFLRVDLLTEDISPGFKNFRRDLYQPLY